MRLLVSGSTATVRRLASRHAGRLGCLLTPANRNGMAALLATGLPWAADNGAYSGLDEGAFRRMCRKVAGRPRCLFVVCPDAVGDARATLALWRAWRGEVLSLAAGQPLVFIGQDGAEALQAEGLIPWSEFSAWFIGGSTAWKLSPASAALAAEAKARGKWVHMGRVNSRRRMAAALDMGCDSVDGSSASMFGDKYIHRYCRWIDSLCAQRTLAFPQQQLPPPS